MPRITWGSSGVRFYETGIDRGVLYVDDVGYPWNGLISVSDAPTGGEPIPLYLDGFKYLNLSEAEEFEATLSAFNSPPEFGPCEGIKSIQNGLYAAQQPKKTFGLSYRTKIGNDTDGQDHGYKLHLVYNALASPSERENSTIEDTAEPATFDWGITTLAPEIDSYKPTAHMIVDSRSTPPALLEALEDILYGTDTVVATLIAPQDLVDMFIEGV